MDAFVNKKIKHFSASICKGVQKYYGLVLCDVSKIQISEGNYVDVGWIEVGSSTESESIIKARQSTNS